MRADSVCLTQVCCAICTVSEKPRQSTDRVLGIFAGTGRLQAEFAAQAVAADYKQCTCFDWASAGKEVGPVAYHFLYQETSSLTHFVQSECVNTGCRESTVP